MMASELAAKLASMIIHHGDFPVEVDGYDIGDVWLMDGVGQPHYYFSYST